MLQILKYLLKHRSKIEKATNNKSNSNNKKIEDTLSQRKIDKYYSDEDLKYIESEIDSLNITDELFTKNFCTNMINKDPFALKIVPEERIDTELCELAISKCGLVLKYVPDWLKTEELCYKAIMKHSKSIKYACSSILNDNGFINSLLNNLKIHINDLPENLITYDKCFNYIDNRKIAEYCLLQYVPDKYKDKKMCELAFLRNASNIQFIPQKYQSIDLWISAIDKDKKLLRYLPDVYELDRKIYISAIQWDTIYFTYIPNKRKDFDMCVYALNQCKKTVDRTKERTSLFKKVYEDIPQKWRNKVCLYININENDLEFYLNDGFRTHIN